MLWQSSFLFLKLTGVSVTTNALLIKSNDSFFVSLHLKLGSFWANTQLVDIFNYQIFAVADGPADNKNFVLVHQFARITDAKRLFLFSPTNLTKTSANISISELFFGANWLEREAAELFAHHFFNKKDRRNLMLCYGDSTAPFNKAMPSLGLTELSYSVFNDTLMLHKLTLQH